MDSNTTVTLMFVSGFLSVSLIIRMILNYRLKSRAVKSGLVNPEGIKLLSTLNGNESEKALKWGLLLFFGGLGLVAVHFTGDTAQSVIPYAVESIFIAFGYFTYYLIVRKHK